MQNLPIRVIFEEDECVAELIGKEPDESVATLYFPEGKFGCFWYSDETITYYVDQIQFACDNTPDNLKKCEELCNLKNK